MVTALFIAGFVALAAALAPEEHFVKRGVLLFVTLFPLTLIEHSHPAFTRAVRSAQMVEP